MDAPPDKEDCSAFVHVAQMIEAVSVQAPHIYHYNPDMGFMLLSDLGSTSYLSQLDDKHADVLYKECHRCHRKHANHQQRITRLRCTIIE